MLDEFEDLYASVQGFLEKAHKVMAEGEPDDIDLSELDIPIEKLASNAFFTGGPIPGERVAFREAYDFVKSHQRIIPLFKRTRAECYAKAAGEAERLMERNKHLRSQLTRMIKRSEEPDNGV